MTAGHSAGRHPVVDVDPIEKGRVQRYLGVWLGSRDYKILLYTFRIYFLWQFHVYSCQFRVNSPSVRGFTRGRGGAEEILICCPVLRSSGQKRPAAGHASSRSSGAAGLGALPFSLALPGTRHTPVVAPSRALPGSRPALLVVAGGPTFATNGAQSSTQLSTAASSRASKTTTRSQLNRALTEQASLPANLSSTY